MCSSDLFTDARDDHVKTVGTKINCRNGIEHISDWVAISCFVRVYRFVFDTRHNRCQDSAGLIIRFGVSAAAASVAR